MADLLHHLLQPVWASGRATTVMGWLQWLVGEDLLERYPMLTVHGALMHALLGHPAEAEAWSLAAERSSASTDPQDGSSMDGILAYMRACLCREGVAAMRSDAVQSSRELDPTSPYRAVCSSPQGFPISSRATPIRRTGCSSAPPTRQSRWEPCRSSPWCRPDQDRRR